MTLLTGKSEGPFDLNALKPNEAFWSQHSCVPAYRRRARGLRPALRAESRPSGVNPWRLRPHVNLLGPARSACRSVLSLAVEGAVLLFPSPYHGVLAVKGCACCARWRPGGRLRPLTACAAPCWPRFRAIPPE